MVKSCHDPPIPLVTFSTMIYMHITNTTNTTLWWWWHPWPLPPPSTHLFPGPPSSWELFFAKTPPFSVFFFPAWSNVFLLWSSNLSCFLHTPFNLGNYAVAICPSPSKYITAPGTPEGRAKVHGGGALAQTCWDMRVESLLCPPFERTCVCTKPLGALASVCA